MHIEAECINSRSRKVPAITTRIDVPKRAIEGFCRQNRIRRLALFGSVLREDFTPDSDVDVLVEFDPAAQVGMIGLAGMEMALSQILGRRAEIHTPKGLNPRFRADVLRAAEVQYEQA